MSLFFSFKYKYVVNYWLSVDCAAVLQLCYNDRYYSWTLWW